MHTKLYLNFLSNSAPLTSESEGKLWVPATGPEPSRAFLSATSQNVSKSSSRHFMPSPTSMSMSLVSKNSVSSSNSIFRRFDSSLSSSKECSSSVFSSRQTEVGRSSSISFQNSQPNCCDVNSNQFTTQCPNQLVTGSQKVQPVDSSIATISSENHTVTSIQKSPSMGNDGFFSSYSNSSGSSRFNGAIGQQFYSSINDRSKFDDNFIRNHTYRVCASKPCDKFCCDVNQYSPPGDQVDKSTPVFTKTNQNLGNGFMNYPIHHPLR